jgi:hypothetical protein
MRWIKAAIPLTACIVLSAIPTLAQGTISFAVDDSQPILNAPYSVAEETEHNQTLGDGTHMVTRSQTHLYRDSYGRTRKERFASRNGTGSNEPIIIEINDPVAGTGYTLLVGERVARRVAPPAQFPTNPNVVRKPPSPAESLHPKTTSENLGTQSIEGVMADGVRNTTVYPEGMMGNDRPIQFVHETWVSPELRLTLQEKTTDPRFGDTITRVTSLNRSEPDPALFQVPPDYILQEPNTK